MNHLVKNLTKTGILLAVLLLLVVLLPYRPW